MNSEEEKYMLRCIQLAQNGLCNTATNPMVGAVIVCDGTVSYTHLKTTSGCMNKEGIKPKSAILLTISVLPPLFTNSCRIVNTKRRKELYLHEIKLHLDVYKRQV